MPVKTTFTQDQLTALDNAIASGALIVRYADKTVQYRSLTEMLTLRNLMKSELQQGANGRKYAKFNKGLGTRTSSSYIIP
jgi:hypothetical protein